MGGGAVETEAVRDMLSSFTVVWVDVSAEEGARRTQADNSRPILAGSDPVATYRRLKERRAPLYRAVAAFKVRTDKRRPQQIVADVLNWIDEEKTAHRRQRENIHHDPIDDL